MAQFSTAFLSSMSKRCSVSRSLAKFPKDGQNVAATSCCSSEKELGYWRVDSSDHTVVHQKNYINTNFYCNLILVTERHITNTACHYHGGLTEELNKWFCRTMRCVRFIAKKFCLLWERRNCIMTSVYLAEQRPSKFCPRAPWAIHMTSESYWRQSLSKENFQMCHGL